MLNFKPSSIFILLLIAVSSAFDAFGQLKIVSINRQIGDKKFTSGRTSSLPATALPFWDDFSTLNTNSSDIYYPLKTVWENSNSVWVNSGTGINPPSLNVATFDGYDSLGKPYAVNNVLSNGLADRMTSGAIKLGDVTISDRASVYISFFYQFEGNGDAPEPGDALSLLFKNATGQWKQVWSIESNSLSKSDEFIQVLLPVKAAEYFHNGFQFRFQNFGRLSGPYDTWNLDYVYLNKGRSINDRSYPDRALAQPMTSALNNYCSIPIEHARGLQFSNPKFTVVNLKNTPQPINNFLSVSATTYLQSAKSLSTIQLDEAANPVLLKPNDRLEIQSAMALNIASLNLSADSIYLKYKLNINTKDNQVFNGDYDPSVFSPIDFRANDTTSRTFVLSKYYAYDDGVAEYGASVTGAGAQMAYQFDMATTAQDTIVAIDLFFPKFGDESTQNLELHVLSAITGNPSDYLLQQSIPVQRTNRNEKNIFQRVTIPGGVIVQNKFYVGWKVLSAAEIPIGLDANNDSGDKIFVNSTGSWIQNKILKGSLMIRPVFGKPKELTTNVIENATSKPFPNPTRQRFYLPTNATQIQFYSVTGSPVSFDKLNGIENTEIKINSPQPGLYIVRYYTNVWHTEKIMVAP